MKSEYSKNGLMTTDKHVFFYKNNCPFSNFYCPCRFIYTALGETHEFFSSEQAFMWHKAKLFGDANAARIILLDGNLDPALCKKYGRMVKNYDNAIWDKVRYDVFLHVNLEKFTQNDDLRKFILDNRFDGKLFVEASPYDSIWGICMKMSDPDIDDESKWRGWNLLGKVITEVREVLKKNSNI